MTFNERLKTFFSYNFLKIKTWYVSLHYKVLELTV